MGGELSCGFLYKMEYIQKGLGGARPLINRNRDRTDHLITVRTFMANIVDKG